MKARTYGRPPPRLDLEDLERGRLVVLEGQDGVGRSTQADLLTDWLQQEGYAVTQVGLSRSRLAGEELEAAKRGHQLRPQAMALFYAADFYDQMEHRIVPALRAGHVVLSDRYVHSLVARALVRGLERDWLESVYEFALVPHAVFYLEAKPRKLMERMLWKFGQLDFWESGMDLGLSGDWTESFLAYQRRLGKAFASLQGTYDHTPVNANRAVRAVQKDLREHLAPLLAVPPRVVLA